MKRTKAITLTAVVLAAIGLGTDLGLSEATAATSTTAAASTAAGTTTTAAAGTNGGTSTTAATTRTAAASSSYVVLDCGFKPRVRPSVYVLTCADYGIGIKDMRWTSWTPNLASGYGTFWENNCTPNCAAGKVIDYPVLATFWGSARVAGHPADRRYTELTVIFPGKRPPLYSGPGKASYPLTQTFPANYDHR